MVESIRSVANNVGKMFPFSRQILFRLYLFFWNWDSIGTTPVAEYVRRNLVGWWLCGSDIHPGAPQQIHSFSLRQAECVEVGSLPLADEVSSWDSVCGCAPGFVHVDMCSTSSWHTEDKGLCRPLLNYNDNAHQDESVQNFYGVME